MTPTEKKTLTHVLSILDKIETTKVGTRIAKAVIPDAALCREKCIDSIRDKVANEFYSSIFEAVHAPLADAKSWIKTILSEEE